MHLTHGSKTHSSTERYGRQITLTLALSLIGRGDTLTLTLSLIGRGDTLTLTLSLMGRGDTLTLTLSLEGRGDNDAPTRALVVPCRACAIIFWKTRC